MLPPSRRTHFSFPLVRYYKLLVLGTRGLYSTCMALSLHHYFRDARLLIEGFRSVLVRSGFEGQAWTTFLVRFLCLQRGGGRFTAIIGGFCHNLQFFNPLCHPYRTLTGVFYF